MYKLKYLKCIALFFLLYTAYAGVAYANPALERELLQKMLVLQDGRDMRLAIMRIGKIKGNEDAAFKGARELTLGDLVAYVKARSKAIQLRYTGKGFFHLEAIKLRLDETFTANNALFSIQLTPLEHGTKVIEGAMLMQVVFDQQDKTGPAGIYIYHKLLEGKTR